MVTQQTDRCVSIKSDLKIQTSFTARLFFYKPNQTESSLINFISIIFHSGNDMGGRLSHSTGVAAACWAHCHGNNRKCSVTVVET